ncbi:MAG: helix-turn-helix domain-containing protein [Magnetovibrio sp.]|nr:helix-turn-helix domain-containing protein [Magnetovibrio sp.]
MYHVLGLAFEGCQASGLASPFDVFNVVNTLWKQGYDGDAPYRCSIVSRSDAPIKTSNGTRILADYTLDNAPDADLVIVPGIHHDDSQTLLNKLHRLDRETHWLRQRFHSETLIAANCSGVFLLAQTGALDCHDATTAWWLGGTFQKRYPQVNLKTDQVLAQNPTTYCTGSMTANLGVMLQIAERQVGRQLAQACARAMLIDASQDTGSPYVFLQDQSGHQDGMVLAVESWVQRYISQPLDMPALAAHHSVSVRTLTRRFKKANGVNLSEYLQNLRLEYTKQLLETTNLSIERVVERVGYGSPSALRRLFQKKLGLSPRAYRQRVKVNVPPAQV